MLSFQRPCRRLGHWPVVLTAASMLGGLSSVATAQELQEAVYRPLAPAAVPASLAGQMAAGVGGFRIDQAVVGEMGVVGNVAEIELPLGPGASMQAELFRQTILSEDARVISVGPGGVETPVRVDVQIWTGTVAGDPTSTVFLGISSHQAQGWIHAAGHTWLIATREVGGVPVTLAYEQGVLNQFAPTDVPACAGEVVSDDDVAPAATGPAEYSSRVGTCKAFRLAVDTDTEFRNLFGFTETATEYAIILAAASSDIYNREIGMGLRLSYLRIWDTPDPWTSGTTSAELTEFRSYWRTNMGSVTRASAHMLSGRALGGGIAYLRAACSNQNGYGVSANLAGSFPFPVLNNNGQNWDLMVFSHELGHQFGSEHTHNSCAYNPIIDGCGLNPANSACEQGTSDCTVATSNTATIMSYCHLCSGGMGNMQMTFGPRVIARMTSYVNGLSCPTTLDAPVLASVTQSPSGTMCSGTPVTFVASATGTELRYQWYRNGGRLINATSATLLVDNPVDGNRYDVVVYSACGMIATFGTPMSHQLSVGGSAPAISDQPVSTTTCADGPTEVSVTATGTGTFTYAWEVRNLSLPSGWQSVSNGPIVINDTQVALASGAATSTLSLTGFEPGWRTSGTVAGRGLRCIVGGSCGSAASTLSGVAVVTVCRGDVNCDGGIDGGDIDAFFDLWEAGDSRADFNADGGVDGSDLGTFYAIWEGGC